MRMCMIKLLKMKMFKFWGHCYRKTSKIQMTLVVLTDIVKLSVTIRGFSMVASWMEVYKNKEHQNTQKSTGLRKSLSGAK